jgi:hypothetical protein
MSIEQKIAELGNRFIRRVRIEEPPPAPNEVEQSEVALKEWLGDERSRHLIGWLDTQIEAAEAQRNLSFKDHSSIVIAVGFENGLKAVRKYLLSLSKE